MTPDHKQQGDTTQNSVWVPDRHTLGAWAKLQPGTVVTVLKRSAKHGGEDRARYPGLVVESSLASPWVEIEAHWTAGTISQAHLTFENGDILREIFSPLHPFNAFAAYNPLGALKGWYANVTYPTLLEELDDRPAVVWHDLFIDIVTTPDGIVAVLDEDELDESGLRTSDPQLHDRILAARDELLERFRNRQPPFHQSSVSQDGAFM